MASGDTLGVFDPKSGDPSAATFAQFDVRNSIPVCAFDAATEELMVFPGVLPANYAGGGITFDIFWMAASATSGNVVWGAAMERENPANHDQDTDAWAAEVTATGAADATSGKITKTSITLTSGAQMDSATADDPYRVKIARKAADGSDTMTGDAQLLRILVRET